MIISSIIVFHDSFCDYGYIRTTQSYIQTVVDTLKKQPKAFFITYIGPQDDCIYDLTNESFTLFTSESIFDQVTA